MCSATEMVAEIYAHWIERSRIITTNLWSSELAKLAANAFLAQRLSTVLVFRPSAFLWCTSDSRSVYSRTTGERIVCGVRSHGRQDR
jgi:glycine/D-amino acid oxidase-like deaminating enzyme